MGKLAVTIHPITYEINLDAISPGSSKVQVELDGEIIEAILPDMINQSDQRLQFIIEDRPYEAVLNRDMALIRSQWGTYQLKIQDMNITLTRPETGDGRVKAPIPGLVTSILVSIGEDVLVGQPLLILEAMKMENEILATRAGIIERLDVQIGQRVGLGQVMIEIV